MKLRFDDVVLDLDARQLRRGGTDLHLSPKAFDLLAILIAQRPGVVNKDALRDRLWGSTNVVEANLNNLVSEIRSALGDDPQKPRYVRTVHRVGYAFCGPASEDHASGPAAADTKGWLIWNERAFPLKEGANLIGRDPASSIWIDAPGVSRRHAAIQLGRDGQAVIEDLKSTNGTFVDRRRIQQPAPIADAASIGIGDATLTYRTQASVSGPTKRIKRKA